MKLNLLNTPSGLKPCYDEDFDEKKKLKIGQVYQAEIKMKRNYLFHKKYFALVKLAWEYLPEKTSAGFRTIDNFRKYCEVAAGHCDTFYSPKLKEWVEVPKSISFDSMDEAAFQTFYENVSAVIFKLIGRYVSEEEFMNNLANF